MNYSKNPLQSKLPLFNIFNGQYQSLYQFKSINDEILLLNQKLNEKKSFEIDQLTQNIQNLKSKIEESKLSNSILNSNDYIDVAIDISQLLFEKSSKPTSFNLIHEFIFEKYKSFKVLRSNYNIIISLSSLNNIDEVKLLFCVLVVKLKVVIIFWMF